MKGTGTEEIGSGGNRNPHNGTTFGDTIYLPEFHDFSGELSKNQADELQKELAEPLDHPVKVQLQHNFSGWLRKPLNRSEDVFL